MYEFVIPEPSRFFKEAIIKDSENNSDAMVIKKPIHPSELSIGLRLDSSRDLTRANYQKISSIYGAIINSYPEAELSVSKSFAFSF